MLIRTGARDRGPAVDGEEKVQTAPRPSNSGKEAGRLTDAWERPLAPANLNVCRFTGGSEVGHGPPRPTGRSKKGRGDRPASR